MSIFKRRITLQKKTSNLLRGIGDVAGPPGLSGPNLHLQSMREEDEDDLSEIGNDDEGDNGGSSEEEESAYSDAEDIFESEDDGDGDIERNSDNVTEAAIRNRNRPSSGCSTDSTAAAFF